jgi:hypothetical protein
MELMEHKRGRIYLSEKMHMKKVFADKDFHLYPGDPLCKDKNLSPGIPFLVHFNN